MRAWRAPLWLKALFGLGIAPLWGGTPAGYTTYFSSDSTPLFVMLVAALARREPGMLDAAGERPRRPPRDAARQRDPRPAPGSKGT